MNAYIKTFVTANGKELSVLGSYQGRYIQAVAKREYLNSDKERYDNMKSFAGSKFVKRTRTVVDKGTLEKFEVRDTMVVAEDKNWQEHTSINSYTGEHASNCSYYTKVEVLLMDEEYSRRIFYSWNGNFSVCDFMKDADEILYEELMQNPERYYATSDEEEDFVQLEFYTDEGDTAMIEICGHQELASKVAGIRVVDFEEKITD